MNINLYNMQEEEIRRLKDVIRNLSNRKQYLQSELAGSKAEAKALRTKLREMEHKMKDKDVFIGQENVDLNCNQYEYAPIQANPNPGLYGDLNGYVTNQTNHDTSKDLNRLVGKQVQNKPISPEQSGLTGVLMEEEKDFLDTLIRYNPTLCIKSGDDKSLDCVVADMYPMNNGNYVLRSAVLQQLRVLIEKLKPLHVSQPANEPTKKPVLYAPRTEDKVKNVYEYIGEAAPAGNAAKILTDRVRFTVYRDTTTGKLYFMADYDFNDKMEWLND